MKRTNSVSILTLQTLCVVWLGTLGCSSSNTPAVTAAGGNASTTTGGSTNATAGGSTNASTASTGGATSSSGTGGAATAGGSTAAGVGGSTGTGTLGSPLCGTLVDGTTAIAKNVNCATADTQFCYKKCGPLSSGFKTETCATSTTSPTGFAYAEQSGTITCSFPVGPSYSCYKVPAAGSYDPTCPTTAPTAGQPCTQAACVVCGPNYFDTGNASKVGYCVCNASATSPTWSCASTSAWPCPAGAGCT